MGSDSPHSKGAGSVSLTRALSTFVRDAASLWKWGSLLVFLFQNAETPLLFRLATTEAKPGEGFCTALVLFITEALKFVFSLILIAIEENWSGIGALRVFNEEVIKKPRDTLALAVPAVLYALQNGLLQWSSSNVPAAIWQVTYQGKTLLIALMSVLLLQKQFLRAQWLAIGIMGLGIAVIQLSGSRENKQSSMGNAASQDIVTGLIELLIACCCSGFASVYFEKIVKQGGVTQKGGAPPAKKASVWVQNVQLALFTMLITSWGVGLAIMNPTGKSGTIGDEAGPTFSIFRGFTYTVFAMALNNAVGGLLVALVIKNADNVLRSFASALATVLAAVASVFCFGFQLGSAFGVGTLMVLGSTLLYGGIIKLPGDWWNAECEACRALRREAPGARGRKEGTDEELKPMKEADLEKADQDSSETPAATVGAQQ